MQPRPSDHAASSSPLDASWPTDAATLVERAQRIEHARDGDPLRSALRGKILALLCERADDDAAQLFRRAVTELGGRVAHVQPKLDAHSSAQDIQHTAHVLGRLYDAIECHGMEPRLMAQIRSDSGVPVYGGIALSSHPSARLAARLGRQSPLADRRCRIVQAILLGGAG